MRRSGVLLHISSLPTPGAIGSLGAEAYSFVDFLAGSGVRVWQTLPCGPTGFGDSPYQSASVFAGNPYFIDIPFLYRDGLVDAADVPAVPSAAADYGRLYVERPALLRKAWRRGGALMPAVERFAAETPWLDGYAFFAALKRRFGGAPWSEWPEAIRMGDEAASARLRAELAGDMEYERFVQFLFFRQWNALRAHAAARGVLLMGDAPIYAAMDSADVWGEPGSFQLGADRRPAFVAGVPPDYFSEDGQLWGNPLYDWDAMAADGFSWWRRRMEASARMYDILRIDHFIGFAKYCAVPAGAPNAREGRWRPGPGRALFEALRPSIGAMEIVAENLGAVSPEVTRLLEYTGFPGMAVLSFGFDGDPENPNALANIAQNCVCYTGTHDNETLPGWWASTGDRCRKNAMADCGFASGGDPAAAITAAAFASRADTVIVPMQDLLGLGSEARMNTPGTVGGANWRWRMAPGALTPRLSARIRALNAGSGR